MKFRGGGRDGTVLEEDGRKVNIFTELLTGKTSRDIHANSIKKYEPPHEGEPLTPSDRRKSSTCFAKNMTTAALATRCHE